MEPIRPLTRRTIVRGAMVRVLSTYFLLCRLKPALFALALMVRHTIPSYTSEQPTRTDPSTQVLCDDDGGEGTRSTLAVDLTAGKRTSCLLMDSACRVRVILPSQVSTARTGTVT